MTIVPSYTMSGLIYMWLLQLVGCIPSIDPSSMPIALITCCNAESLQRTVTSLAQAKGFTSNQLYIFQDAVGKYSDVDELLSQMISKGLLLQDHLFHHKHDDIRADSHVLISRHYKHMFQVFFNLPDQFEHVLIIEDDLIVSLDILEYFAATAGLVHNDSSLFSVSGWNDHGFKGMVGAQTDNEAGFLGIHRADHFPGLGWLCTRRLWLELKNQWPDFVWDVWTRMPTVNKGRHTLVPEVPRTHHIGRSGTSMHLVDFDKWFHSMAMAEDVDWSWFGERSLAEMSRQLSLEIYEAKLSLELARSIHVDSFWDIFDNDTPSTFRMCYHPTLWRGLAQYLGLWPPIPMDGLPIRGLTFKGVTRFQWKINETRTHTVLLGSTDSPLLSGLSQACIVEDHLYGTLPPPPRQTLPDSLRIRPGQKGQSCSEACASRGMWCSPDAKAGGYGGYISNNSPAAHHLQGMGGCPVVVEAFGAACMGGCIAVPNEELTPVGYVLPCLWSEAERTTCLVSPRPLPLAFDCAKAAPDAQRLCPCIASSRSQT